MVIYKIADDDSGYDLSAFSKNHYGGGVEVELSAEFIARYDAAFNERRGLPRHSYGGQR